MGKHPDDIVTLTAKNEDGLYFEKCRKMYEDFLDNTQEENDQIPSPPSTPQGCAAVSGEPTPPPSPEPNATLDAGNGAAESGRPKNQTRNYYRTNDALERRHRRRMQKRWSHLQNYYQ